jgi:hypothetical protein
MARDVQRGDYIEGSGEEFLRGDQGYEYKGMGQNDGLSDHMIRARMESEQYMRREWVREPNDNATEDYRDGEWWG